MTKILNSLAEASLLDITGAIDQMRDSEEIDAIILPEQDFRLLVDRLLRYGHVWIMGLKETDCGDIDWIVFHNVYITFWETPAPDWTPEGQQVGYVENNRQWEQDTRSRMADMWNLYMRQMAHRYGFRPGAF